MRLIMTQTLVLWTVLIMITRVNASDDGLRGYNNLYSSKNENVNSEDNAIPLHLQNFNRENKQAYERILKEKASSKKKAGKENKVPSILGGGVAAMNEFPFYALLSGKAIDVYQDDQTKEIEGLEPDLHYCGGVLIANDIVLTAAHCLESTKDEGEISRVDINPYNLNKPHDNQRTVGASRIVMHPEYSDIIVNGNWVLQHDIGIVKLSESITNLPKLRIPKPSDPVPSAGQSTCVIGFGDTTAKGDDSLVMKKTFLDYVPYNQCKSQMGSFYPNFPTDWVCAHKPGTSNCYGDSGGPALIKQNNEWVGLGCVSTAKDCVGSYPSLFAGYAANYDWIRRTTCMYTDADISSLQFDCSDVTQKFTCLDQPNWADSDGDGCSWYTADFDPFAYYDDEIYAEYHSRHTRCAELGNCCRSTMTAWQACCECGGGIVSFQPVNHPSNPVPQPSQPSQPLIPVPTAPPPAPSPPSIPSGITDQRHINIPYSQDGMIAGLMFEIRAKKPLVVYDMDLHVGTTSMVDLEIFTKEGSFEGFERSPGYWRSVKNTSIKGMGINLRTPCGGIEAVFVDASNSHSFYFTLKDNKLVYSNRQKGSIFVDNSDITLYSGVSAWYKFGRNAPGRVIGGRIYYLV